jgi:hypothetical protein
MKDGLGNPQWVKANLVDVLGQGCGLALMTRLKSGSTVVLRGKFGEKRPVENLKAGVRWCVGKTDGTFRAGLEFLDGRATLDGDNAVALDCYEVMQLSPDADAKMIARTYRTLAFRYHPDNAETGNAEMFLRLSEAHQILSDPQKRPAYDARYRYSQRRNIEFAADAYLGVTSLGCTLTWEG